MTGIGELRLEGAKHGSGWQTCGLPGKGENINHLVSKSTILNLPANWHPRNLPGKELGAPKPLNRTLICLPMDLKDNMQKQ